MDTIGKGKQSSDGDWLVVSHWSEVFRLPLQCAVELLLISGEKQSHVVHHEKLSVQFSCFLWLWWQRPRKSLHWHPLFITCSHVFLLVICCSLYPLRADWFVDIFKTLPIGCLQDGLPDFRWNVSRPGWFREFCIRCPSNDDGKIIKLKDAGHCCPQFSTSAPASTLLWATQLSRGARANTNLT